GQARHRPRPPAPARHEHRRGGRPGEEAPAHVPRRGAGRDRHGGAVRPHRVDPQFRGGSDAHALCRPRPRSDGDLHFPAQRLGDHHPGGRLAASNLGHFALMYVLGYSLDNISLMALTLCVGFVVDDAIVMLENISRHMEMGKSAWQATMEGSKEISFTILSMTLSLAAVFLPIFFMGGILGRLLHEFAVVIIVAVLISGFVSLTLTPMMCSRILRPHTGERHGRLYMFFERAFDGARDLYGASLHWTIAHRRIVMFAFLGLVVLTGVLFARAKTGFLPSEDSGQLFIFTEGPQDASFEQMVLL